MINFRWQPIILRFTQFCTLITIALAPFWLKWAFAPPPFTPTYILGMVIVVPMVAAVVSWGLSGCYGLAALFTNRWQMVWFATLLLLPAWGTLSQAWAFIAADRPGVAQNAALHLWIVTFCVLVAACVRPPIRLVLAILIGSMLLHGAIGGLQAAQQSDLGLQLVGERSLDPAESGISVIQAGEWRWLRAYGLLPHPNNLGGVLAVGLLACAGWVMTAKRFYWLSVVVFGIGLWFLLLTFSRSAWLGFGAGILVALPFVARADDFWKRLLPLALVSIVLGSAFVALYQPLVQARLGLVSLEQTTEIRSVVDRAIYTEIAEIAINERPLIGHGAGNFDWYASYYLFYNTNYDLPGDNVHNIYLKVWAELGIIGLGLLLIHLTSGVMAVLQHPTIERIALLAGVMALAVVSLFDHYTWTLIQIQTLWLGMLALALAPDHSSASSANKSAIDLPMRVFAFAIVLLLEPASYPGITTPRTTPPTRRLCSWDG